jgi:hypothetical protein
LPAAAADVEARHPFCDAHAIEQRFGDRLHHAGQDAQALEALLATSDHVMRGFHR